MPHVCPWVESEGESPIHFLVIFAADTDPDDIDRTIAHVFRANDRFDPRSGTPLATGHSVNDFGSIDQRDFKDQVKVIMEGSAEDFRLRQERYGY